MTFNKNTKTTQLEKDRIFIKWCWKNWVSTQKNEVEALQYTICKINSKWLLKTYIKT